MKEAIALAKKAEGLTAPNPVVGAVYEKDGVMIGAGYHKGAGKDHAEVAAAKDAKRNGYTLEGTTLYTTLEPCSHYGKTPPCAEFLVDAGVTHVVVGMKDDFRLVNGGGLKKLRAAGVQVTLLPHHSALAKDIRLLNQPFSKWSTTGLPYVTLKAAVSLDGKIATRTGNSKWITTEASRRDARKERSKCDAVLVGSGTVAADDPELAAHGAYKKKNILRVILDDTLSLPTTKHVFRDEHVFVATTDQAKATKKEQYTKKGIAFKSFGRTRISIKKLLQYLGKQEVQHVYVEGGASVHGSFHDDALSDPLTIDRIIWYISPRIIGGVDSLSSIGGKGVASLDDHVVMKKVAVNTIDGDIKIESRLNVY